jgi:N-acetylglucosaminyl-diphospho-decaprenol L-rhamnosyltransferase
MLDLSIVIVNWNTRQLLANCLESVFACAGSLCLEVIVVDNASGDGSPQWVREHFPQVRLVENTENVGFARANNQAFPLCNAPFVLLLNSDTIVRPGAFQTLLAFLAAHPRVGAAAPKIVHPATRLRVLSCGYQPGVRTLFNQYFFLSSLFPHIHAFRGINLLMGAHDDQPRPVEWLSGAALMVRREVIEQVGPLSEEWFMYAEDMEWCRRMQQAGWMLYHVPEAVIEHLLGASAEQNQAVSTLWVRSQRSYYIRSQQPEPWRLFLFDRIFTSGLALRAALYSLRGRLSPQGELWREEARKFSAYAATAAEAAREGSKQKAAGAKPGGE